MQLAASVMIVPVFFFFFFFIFIAARQQADQSFTITPPLTPLRKTLQVAELISEFPFRKTGRFITTDAKLAFLHYVDVSKQHNGLIG